MSGSLNIPNIGVVVVRAWVVAIGHHIETGTARMLGMT
jgi:hypothetical protein